MKKTTKEKWDTVVDWTLNVIFTVGFIYCIYLIFR